MSLQLCGGRALDAGLILLTHIARIGGRVFATLFFALFGFLSPANRGGLITALILLYVLCASFAGYHASRTYKMFRGIHWKKTTVLTAVGFPGALFCLYGFLNLILKWQKSSGAVPFTTIFMLLALWVCISTPLVFAGAYFGFRKDTPAQPTRTNQIPRQIPPQPWLCRAIRRWVISRSAHPKPPPR